MFTAKIPLQLVMSTGVRYFCRSTEYLRNLDAMLCFQCAAADCVQKEYKMLMIVTITQHVVDVCEIN